MPDPELPPVTLGMLGMVHDVRVDDRDVAVELLPTWSGWPATDVIAEDVRACPYCGSTDTERDGLFGPTPCRDVRFSNACTQPFEAFKP